MAEVEQAKVTKLWDRNAPFVSETAEPTPECVEPSRWTMMDDVAPEIEVLNLLRTTVKATKPASMAVFGDVSGYITLYLAQAARENGIGIVSVAGVPQEQFDHFLQVTHEAGMQRWVNVLGTEHAKIPSPPKLAFFDGSAPKAEETFEAFLGFLSDGCIVYVHDAAIPTVRALIKNRASVYYPTPRGLLVFQK